MRGAPGAGPGFRRQLARLALLRPTARGERSQQDAQSASLEVAVGAKSWIIKL